MEFSEANIMEIGNLVPMLREGFEIRESTSPDISSYFYFMKENFTPPQNIYLILLVTFIASVLFKNGIGFMMWLGLHFVLNGYILYKIPQWTLQHPKRCRNLSIVLIVVPLLLIGFLYFSLRNIRMC